MFERILVPLDGSERAERALPFAAEIARRAHAAVLLTTVVEHSDSTRVEPERNPQTVGGELDIILGQATIGGNFEDPYIPKVPPHDYRPGGGVIRTEEYLAQVEERLRSSVGRVRHIVAVGRASDRIGEIARREGCDLIVMATHEHHLAMPGFHQSMASGIEHHAPCPVLLVPTEASAVSKATKPEVETVVVLVDKPTQSQLAGVNEASKLAEVFEARLVLIRCTEDSERDEAGAGLDDLKHDLESRGVVVQTEIRHGHLRDEIAAALDRTPSPVVVTLGNDSLFTRWIGGDIVDLALRTARVPTMVVPEGH